MFFPLDHYFVSLETFVIIEIHAFCHSYRQILNTYFSYTPFHLSNSQRKLCYFWYQLDNGHELQFLFLEAVSQIQLVCYN